MLAKKRWWQIRLPQVGKQDQSRNYRDIVNLSECSSVLANTATTISDSSTTTASSGSPTRHRSCDSLSKSSQAEPGKLFPRNMPSIRRSRRRAVSAERERERERLASRDRPADQVLPPKMPQIGAAQQSRLSTVTKLTPRKTGGKPTCSKGRSNPPPAKCIVKSAVRAKTKPRPRITLAPYEIALELPNQSPAPTLAMAVAQSSGCEKRKSSSEEQFHSSGISCNGETDDDVEVAMLTGSLTPAQLARIQGHQQQHQQQQKAVSFPVGDLRHLNLCRNRNAVWLNPNPKDTEQLIEVDRSRSEAFCYFNRAIADDIQLSDIEEQLARFDGHSKRPPPPAAKL
ncbi:hypothetical protein M5D96_009918 [Drosophila gunungcola]|uniref:Uncharacterized protein n=3 Tax=Drosophila gunungcola TaxID=103775 RepID=A0A9P9YI20_9MUSC|nr:hypothetical protein M5D96_009918 [Drosophila gunungcola]